MNELLIFVGLLIGGVAASEIGFRTATLALVAFLVAFAFSGAGNRFVDRLDVIVDEANALGTAWLRADVLPEPERSTLKTALKEYTADRIALLGSRDWDEIHQLLAKAGDLQGTMW